MRAFNKVVTVLLLLVLFVLLPVIAAIPEEVLAAIRAFTFNAQAWLTPAGSLILAAIAVILWLVTVVLLVMEFRRSRTREIKVTAVEGGDATVQAASVSQLLEQELLQMPAIQQARATVEENREGVVATLMLDTAYDVSVPAVTTEAIERTRGVLENRVGARVANVSVRVRHQAGRREPERRPTPPPVAPPPREEPVVTGPAEVYEPPPPVERHPSYVVEEPAPPEVSQELAAEEDSWARHEEPVHYVEDVEVVERPLEEPAAEDEEADADVRRSL